VTQKTYDRWRRTAGEGPADGGQDGSPTERDSIYRVLYWTKGKCDELAKRSEIVAILHFDACVNHGSGARTTTSRPARWSSCSAPSGVEDDGIWGPKTWENYVSEVIEDGEIKLACRYLKVREAQYKHLAERAPRTLGLNLEGWLKRLDRLRDYLALP
jgi:lysozyme family protein